MNRVIPTVFADDKKEFRNRFNRLIEIARKVEDEQILAKPEFVFN